MNCWNQYSALKSPWVQTNREVAMMNTIREGSVPMHISSLPWQSCTALGISTSYDYITEGNEIVSSRCCNSLFVSCKLHWMMNECRLVKAIKTKMRLILRQIQICMKWRRNRCSQWIVTLRCEVLLRDAFGSHLFHLLKLCDHCWDAIYSNCVGGTLISN